MRPIIFTTVLLLSATFAAFAQNPMPAPTPDDDVVKITTNLIQIDATVTDKKGNVVKDLKPEDFEIYENGKKQTITNFSLIVPGSKNNQANPADRQNSTENSKTPIPLPPVKLDPAQIRRTYAIVVDDLNLSFSSTFWVKDALKRFVNEQMEDGDLVAIVRVGTGLGALQSFTADKRLLLAAVEKIRWNNLANPFSYEPISPTLDDERPEGRSTGPEQKEQTAASLERDKGRALQNYPSLQALNYVIRGMKDLPGRKSIMFYSEGFQAFVRSDQPPGIPKPTAVMNALRAVAESATRASIVLYTFDPRGGYAPGGEAQDDIGRLNGQNGGNSQSIRDRETALSDSTDTLRYLAYETGGIASLGNNINKGIEKVFNDQSYYLLGYQPDSETFDAQKNRFNKLEIRLKRPDLRVRYRSGFYGVTDDEVKQAKIDQTPQQKIYAALSSPFGAGGINLDLYPVFYNDSQNRNYIRALVHIDAKDLTFTPEPDGFYKTGFEVIGSIFDTNGVSANNGISKTTLRFSPENYRRVQKEGVVYNLETPIIVTGGYQFRVAVRDTVSDRIGSASQFIEVPDLDKKRLTLSQLIIRNYPLARWNELVSGKVANFNAERNSFLYNTALREFRRGSVISYYYVIYNAKWDSRTTPELAVKTRLFYNGQLLLENEPQPLNIGDQRDLRRIEASNAITLGTDLAAGDYIMQIIVIDKNADKKKQMATQWIDFAIVE